MAFVKDSKLKREW